MDPLRKLAKLVERGLRLGTARGQQRGERRVAVCLGVPVGEAQLVGECEEPLLGAVMQVALETTSTMRAREARTASSCASTSACRRSFSTARWAADPMSRPR